MYAEDFSQIGSNINKKLKNTEKTQQALAEHLGISKQEVKRIIKGKKAVSVSELSEIASFLGTTVEELLDAQESLAETECFVPENNTPPIKKVETIMNEINMLEELLATH